jgi:hypothetical protein
MGTPVDDNSNPGQGRIAPRFAFEASIRIRLQRNARHTTVGGWVRDISESGLCAFVAESLQLKEAVTLEIPLPKGGEMVIPAKVARSLGTQYGFQFLALSAEQRALIQSLVYECRPLSAQP